MQPWLKYTLIGGGFLFFLKIFDDSRKLVVALRAKSDAANPVNNIAGHPLPAPVEVSTKDNASPVTAESTLANANPDTSYDSEWFG